MGLLARACIVLCVLAAEEPSLGDAGQTQTPPEHQHHAASDSPAESAWTWSWDANAFGVWNYSAR